MNRLLASWLIFSCGWLPNAMADSAAIIATFAAENSVPGIALATFSAKDLTRVELYGLADIEQGIGISEETVFHWASLSKPITALALAEVIRRDGRFDLTSNIGDVAPTLQSNPTITIADVLFHRSGISHWSRAELADPVHQFSVYDAAQSALLRPRRCSPGDCVHYSTPAYNLAGALIEQLTDQSFIVAINQIYDLPASRTIHSADPHALLPNRARGYRQHPNGHLLNAPPLDIGDRIPGGGMAGTILDLAATIQVMVSNPQMLSLTVDAWKTSEGGNIAYHGGSQWGYSAWVQIERVNGDGLVILANRGGVKLQELASLLKGF